MTSHPLIPWRPDPAEMVRNCGTCGEDYTNETPCACPWRLPRSEGLLMAEPENSMAKHRLSYLTVPQMFRLDLACQQIKRAFGGYPYLVGSVLHRPDYRDVDLRLLISDARGGTDLLVEGRRRKFLNAAISEWLASVTGLPIDFQFQAEPEWDEHSDEIRHPRGLMSDG